MKKSVCKIDIIKTDIKIAKADIILGQVAPPPKQESIEDAAPKVKPKIINFKKPKSPLRGRYYDNRANHGHDGSYAGHKRGTVIGHPIDNR